MLSKKVTEPMAKRSLRQHKLAMDAQKALVAICKGASSSTQAVLTRRRNLEVLTRRRFDPKDNKSASTFILEFETMIEEYNEQQIEPDMVLNGPMKKSMLQACLSPVTMLRAVADRETERMVQGGMIFSYEEYLEAVKASASLYDEGRTGRRSVNVMSRTDTTEPLDHNDDAILAYLISKRGKRNPGATMNRETWTGLSDQGKTTWDQLSDQDKRKILQHVSQRGDKPKTTASVNCTEMDIDEPEIPNHDIAIDTEPTETVEANVHDSNNRARSNAHPGDPRRMMGSQKPTNKTTQVKFTSWGHDSDINDDDIEQFVDACWDSSENSDSDFH
jgi:hypothetical protein